MRVFWLIPLALVTCSALAVRAENVTPPPSQAAPPAQEPAASTPEKSSSPQRPAGSASGRADKLPSPETTLERQRDAAGLRFGFQRVDGGFLRFDYQTGHIAFCNPRPEGWGCEAVPEDRAAIEREVERLRAEVADLQKQLKAQEQPPRLPRPIPPAPPSGPPAASPPQPGSGDMTFSLPGRDELARAAAAMQEVWRHFLEMVTAWKNDVLRKSGV